MPKTSCIIPVVGSTDGLETTLLSVLERRPDDCEVLVVLNVPYDDPHQLQGEIQILQAPPQAGLVACINQGIAAAQSPIVHVLASGVEAGDGWIDRALVHFSDPQVAAVTPIIHDVAQRDRVLAAGVSYARGGRKQICRSTAEAERGALASVGPLAEAAFFRKSALAAFGGALPSDIGDELADIDIALSLRAAGARIVLETQCRVFAPSLPEIRPAGFHWGLWSERLYWRHVAHVGWIAGLFSHPIAAVGDLLGTRPWWNSPAQALGRLIAVCQFGHYRNYLRILAAAQADARAAAAQEPPAPKAEICPPPQLRIDASHDAGRKSRHKRAGAVRRRRAAG